MPWTKRVSTASTRAHRALLIAAAALCISALFDLAIFLDFQWSKGANAALIVSNANLLALLFLGPTAIVAARARPLPVVASNIEQAASLAAKDREVLDRIDHLLAEQRLSRDENLTLSRLARRAGVPARRRQSLGAQERLPIYQRLPHCRSLPAAAGDRYAGDRSDARIRLSDEIELQPGIPTRDLPQPGFLARAKPAVATVIQHTGPSLWGFEPLSLPRRKWVGSSQGGNAIGL